MESRMVDVSFEGTKEVDYNMLWYIHGQAYDLTDWLNKHPGEYCDSHPYLDRVVPSIW